MVDELNERLRGILAELRKQLTSVYGSRLERLVLFGSQSRGDAAAGSDIDILVVLRGPVSPGREIARTGGITSALSLENDLVISCTFVSADRYSREQSPLLLNIRREGVPV